jgi:hypothetical protein
MKIKQGEGSLTIAKTRMSADADERTNPET